jgi:hypothetical protein
MYLTYSPRVTAKPPKSCSVVRRDPVTGGAHEGRADVELMRWGKPVWFCARCGCVELGVRNRHE